MFLQKMPMYKKLTVYAGHKNTTDPKDNTRKVRREEELHAGKYRDLRSLQPRHSAIVTNDFSQIIKYILAWSTLLPKFWSWPETHPRT